MKMTRINIAINDEYFAKLKAVNKIENRGLIKEGTFVKKIVMEYLDKKIESDFITIDGITLKQENLFQVEKKKRKK